MGCAGIAEPDWFEDLSLERFRRMIDVHYMGTVNVAFAAWPHMVNAGYGRIVNTCSEAMLGMSPKNTSYGGAKGGVFGFTRTLALEAGRHGIRVNAVAPRANTRLSGPAVMAHVFDVPEEVFADGSTMAPSDRSSWPRRHTFLAHESCALNGVVLVAESGSSDAMAVLQNEDLPGRSAPDIADNLDTVMDISDAHSRDRGVARRDSG